jgi:hypothetical protein
MVPEKQNVKTKNKDHNQQLKNRQQTSEACLGIYLLTKSFLSQLTLISQVKQVTLPPVTEYRCLAPGPSLIVPIK